MLNLKKYIPCLILFPIFFSGCDSIPVNKKEPVITVGKREIYEDKLMKDVEQTLFEMEMTEQEAKPFIKQIVEDLVEEYLILEYGEEKGISITEEELNTRISELKSGYTESAFNQLLLKRYIDATEWHDYLKKNFLLEKIISAAVEEIPPSTFIENMAYYNSHQDDFSHPKMVQVRQVLTSSGEEAEMILKRLSEGEKMEDLAQRYSIAPEAETGGLMGWISEGELDKTMEEFIFSIKEGDRGGILETPYGYHVFEVLSIREPGVRKFPEVMDDISSILNLEKRNEFYGKWINELKDRFPVTIDQDVFDNWSMKEIQQ